MYYSCAIRFYEEDSKYHWRVAIVFAENIVEARKKLLNMYAYCDIYEIKISKIDLDLIRHTATKGGMTIAEFEDFYE